MGKSRKTRNRTMRVTDAKGSTSLQTMSSSDSDGVVDIEGINLRTVGPVTRLRGAVAKITEKLEAIHKKVCSWDGDNEMVKSISSELNQILTGFPSLLAAFKKLEATKYSPPRKGYTALTDVGDKVSILEKYRPQYKDLLTSDLMDDLKVTAKNPNRGGLILEATSGAKVRAAIAHVVRLSQPEAI